MPGVVRLKKGVVNPDLVSHHKSATIIGLTLTQILPLFCTSCVSPVLYSLSVSFCMDATKMPLPSQAHEEAVFG